MKKKEMAELLSKHIKEYKNRDTLDKLIESLRDSAADISDSHIRYYDESAKLGDPVYTRKRGDEE